MMGSLGCRLFGHLAEPARRCPPMMLPTVGLVGGWTRCEPAESRGIGCARCGRYEEHDWVADARAVTGREP